MGDMTVYALDPKTILTSVDQGRIDVFEPALQNPVYDDMPPIWSPGSFSWNQEDHQKVANALHQFVWSESLNKWHPYSANFGILQCKDTNRIDRAALGFYQRQGTWYYRVHNMTIDLGYAIVYAGNNDGYYVGQWKDLDIDTAIVNTAEKALLIAEQNGGEKARVEVMDDAECQISIFLAPFVLDDADWGWRVTYKHGTSFIFGMLIDPYTGSYEILRAGP